MIYFRLKIISFSFSFIVRIMIMAIIRATFYFYFCRYFLSFFPYLKTFGSFLLVFPLIKYLKIIGLHNKSFMSSTLTIYFLLFFLYFFILTLITIVFIIRSFCFHKLVLVILSFIKAS